MSELRAALRLLRHRPGFCAAVVLTLAIAIAAVTAIFSLVHALILRPLPFPEPDRLVAVEVVVAGSTGRLTLLEYQDLARDTRLFEGWGAYYRSQYNVTGGGPPENLTCTISTSTLFGVLGIAPLHGDIWSAREDFTRQYLVALSHHVWQQRFGGRREVIGSTITLDRAAYRVMGVLPEGFDFPLATDIFRAATDYNAPHVRRYSAVARLRADATLADAQAELDGVAARLARTYPQTSAGVAFRATPLRDAYIGRARPFVWLLAGAVALLLVIAWVNVTNLLVSRAIAQRADAGLRLALGADRRHLVRQSLAEALVLAIIGAALGAGAGIWALHGLMSMVQADLPPWFAIRFDVTALLFTAVASLITALGVGLLPALRVSSSDIESLLRQQSTRALGSRGQQRARRALLAAQAALATVLLLTAGTFGLALRDLWRVNPGFAPSHLLTFRVDPPFGRYPDIPTTSDFYRRATEALARLPGVLAVGANTHLPFSGRDITPTRLAVEGQITGRLEDEPLATLQLVDPGYFAAMGVPLLRGRVFERQDIQSTPPVTVVSARTAARLWGDRDPLGRRLRVVWNQTGVGGGGGSDLWLTVVGIVGDVRFTSLERETDLAIYAPHMQLFAGDSYIVVKTGMAPDTLRPQIRAALDQVDPEQSFFEVETMAARVQASVWQQRVAGLVLTVFAGIALCLAVIGTYAVTAEAVASQQAEIAIRLALGSPESRVVGLVFRQWLAPVAGGVLLGSIIAASGARVMSTVTSEGGTATTLLLAVVPLVLLVAATPACYIPVRRTLRGTSLTDVLRAS